MIGKSKKYELIPDYKMKDQTNYLSTQDNKLTPYYGEKIFSPSYEELEAKVWQLEQELAKAKDELNNSLASTDHFAGELEKAMKVINKKNLYAELGRLVYEAEWEIKFIESNMINKYNGIVEQIQENEAGNG